MIRACTIAILVAAGAAHAQVGSVDLSTYTLTATINLPSSPLLEASAVTYNWDTNRLLVVPDSTVAIAEVSLSGVILSQMSMSGFEDTEGITYLGGGVYVITEERQQRVYRFTYVPGGTLVRSGLQNAPLGSPIGNEGIEGISFEPLTEKYFAVKEKTPIRVMEVTINFPASSATVSDLFDPALLGILDIADISVLSTVPSLVGKPDQDNLLILSQQSAMLLEVTRAGVIKSQKSLVGLATTAEGVTIDAQGTIYVCDETPRLYVFKPPVCYANCDGQGGLTANDFQCFLNAFVAGQSYANCDGVGGFTANDFQCFLDKFVAGCP